jgi:hypothetical protein
MLNRSYFAESIIEGNEVLEAPFQCLVFGEVVVREFESHIRISKKDWDKYKQRLIPVLKQGDRKDGNAETGS